MSFMMNKQHKPQENKEYERNKNGSFGVHLLSHMKLLQKTLKNKKNASEMVLQSF